MNSPDSSSAEASKETSAGGVAEVTFRHEYGRIVSALVASFGTADVESIEDAAQAALMRALEVWPRKGVPEKPGAWLWVVARRAYIDERRKLGKLELRCEQAAGDRSHSHLDVDGSRARGETPTTFPDELGSPELQRLLLCCDESLPAKTQLVLALKILCGVSTRELALRLMTSADNVQKRLSRGRKALRQAFVASAGGKLPELSNSELGERVPALQHVLYLLFNEGYRSALADKPIRRELCEEAIRLTRELLQSALGNRPSSWALFALMHFHIAQFPAREAGGGAVVLLEEQDRALWEKPSIEAGLRYLQRAIAPEDFSPYHAEAAISAEHCVAERYEDTRWERIVELYELLEKAAPSPFHTLNRAIALSEWRGPEAGLSLLETLNPPSWLSGYYLWDATLGELHRKAGNAKRAVQHLRQAAEGAPTLAERELLEKRMASIKEA